MDVRFPPETAASATRNAFGQVATLSRRGILTQWLRSVSYRLDGVTNTKGTANFDYSYPMYDSRHRIKSRRPHTVTFQGLEVRAVRGLEHIDDSTLRAMAKEGFAPTTLNGDNIVLHHHQQNPAGFIVEMPNANHVQGRFNPKLHPFGNTPGAGLTLEQRAAFNAWRPDYWKWRAQQELARRVSRR